MRKILGKCSICEAKLYQDQDGYIYPTVNSGGEWFLAKFSWEFDEQWFHTCNPYELNRHGTLIKEIHND